VLRKKNQRRKSKLKLRPHKRRKIRERPSVSKLERMLSIVLSKLLSLRHQRVILAMNITLLIYLRNFCKIYRNKKINMNKVNRSLNQAQTQNLNNLDPIMNQRDQVIILNPEVILNQSLNLKNKLKIKNHLIRKKMLKQKLNQLSQLLRKSLKLPLKRLRLRLKLKSLKLLLL